MVNIKIEQKINAKNTTENYLIDSLKYSEYEIRELLDYIDEKGYEAVKNEYFEDANDSLEEFNKSKYSINVNGFLKNSIWFLTLLKSLRKDKNERRELINKINELVNALEENTGLKFQ